MATKPLEIDPHLLIWLRCAELDRTNEGKHYTGKDTVNTRGS